MSLVRSTGILSNIVRNCTRTATVSMHQRRGYADMAFTFASPAGVFYDNADIKQVDVPTSTGSFGILPNHVPVLAVLKPGVLAVTEANGTVNQYFVSSGTVSVNEDSSVQILSEEACRVSDLDPQAIREGLTRSQHEMTSASSDREKAEAQIAVECFDALQKAAV